MKGDDSNRLLEAGGRWISGNQLGTAGELNPKTTEENIEK